MPKYRDQYMDYAIWRVVAECCDDFGGGFRCFYGVSDNPRRVPDVEMYDGMEIYCVHRVELVCLVASPTCWNGPPLEDWTSVRRMCA